MKKYKSGERVRVINQFNGHQYDIGEIVTIIRQDEDGSFQTKGNSGIYWWVGEEEIEPVKVIQKTNVTPTSQKENILKHLRRGKKITPIEALYLYGCFRLSAIIHKLKRELKDGETIESTLLRKGNKNFACYKLTKINQ